MKLPRVRFTVRWMMIVVAVVGVDHSLLVTFPGPIVMLLP